jgi:c-di-GMP-binding flagellar brake protein YcgR
MDENYIEKRKFKRASVNGSAEFEIFCTQSQSILMKTKREKKEADILNLSLGGLQIISDINISEEQILRMKIIFKESGAVIYAYSQVRWAAYDEQIKKYRIGLEFFYLKDQYRKVCSKILGEKLN